MNEPPIPGARAEGRLTQVDGLRAIAALSVVAFHFTTRYDQVLHHTAPLAWSAGHGYLGVNLFFAISGFVIFMTLDRIRRPADFVISRFSRLYPTYWVAVILSWLVMQAFRLDYHHASFGAALVNLTMLQYFFSMPDVDAAYWSLQVELVFYVWMLLLWVTGLLRHALRVFGAWTLMALAAAIVHRIGREPSYVAHYFLLLQWIPWFALGIAAYVSRREGRIAARHVVLVIIALCAIAAAAGAGTALFGAGVAAVVFGASRSALRALDWKPLVFVGLVSYPLYLVHGNIGFATIHSLESRGIPPSAAIALAVLVSLLLATVLHYTVETRATQSLRRRLRARQVASTYKPRAWAAACIAAIAVAAASLVVTSRLDRFIPAPRPVAVSPTSPLPPGSLPS